MKWVIQALKKIYWNNILMSTLGALICLGTFIFFSGIQLYELFVIYIVVFFLIIGHKIIATKKIKSINKKLHLFFTLTIALFSILGVWVTIYSELPRVYHPRIKCPEYLSLTKEDTNISVGNFSLTFGNYGHLPAWLYIEFKNLTPSFRTIEPNNSFLIVLVPIIYQNNKQTEVIFKFGINNYFQETGFEIKILYFGDDIIDKTAGKIKLFLAKALGIDLLPSLTCNYEKINLTFYKETKQNFI